MKKIITILMVLLVTGVVFGAPYTPAVNPTATTVDITTSNNGLLSHKITSTAVTSNATWTSATLVTTKPVDIGITTAQSVAYYSLKTNTKKTVVVTVTATPLATTGYYIPYTLKVGTKTGTFGTYTASTTAPTTTPSITLDAASINTYTNGMRFLSQEISVQFSENYVDSALEGDYSSTITFAITTTT